MLPGTPLVEQHGVSAVDSAPQTSAVLLRGAELTSDADTSAPQQPYHSSTPAVRSNKQPLSPADEMHAQSDDDSSQGDDIIKWRIDCKITAKPTALLLSKMVVSKTQDCKDTIWMTCFQTMTFRAESDKFRELVWEHHANVVLHDEGFDRWAKASKPRNKKDKTGEKIRLECLEDYFYMMYACTVIGDKAEEWLEEQRDKLDTKSDEAYSRGTDRGDEIAEQLEEVMSEVEELINCVQNQTEAVESVKSAFMEGDPNQLLEVLELGTFALDF